ncbi:unnamed protein product [Brassica oleracea]
MLFLFRCGHKSKTLSSFLHFLLQSNLLYLQFGRKDRTFCFCHFRFLRLIPNVQGQSLFQLNEFFTCSVLPCRKSLRECSFV